MQGQLHISPALLVGNTKTTTSIQKSPQQETFSAHSAVRPKVIDNMDRSFEGKSKSINMGINAKGDVYDSMFENFQTSSGVISQISVPDKSDHRFFVLSYEQVKRLNGLMSKTISIHGRGNFPTIDVRLCDLIGIVRTKLVAGGIRVRDIRFSGSGASVVLAAEFNYPLNDISYNDIDITFIVDLTTEKSYEKVKAAVLDGLLDLLPTEVSRKRMSSWYLREAYVSKMVKVNGTDRWSLISLGNSHAETVELKFVNNMRRQYEFSVDSFHIMLDMLFLFYECCARCSINGESTPAAPSMYMWDNCYPTVKGESMYGDFQEALAHLQKKLIATRNPEEIRGGGLLKYCNLLCKGYRPAVPKEMKHMERCMFSRFFIDFRDINQQKSKVENYLHCHFVAGANHPENDQLKYKYLRILYQVVDESTVYILQ